ncbi:MAG: hypothetical protein IPG71_03675 [bacterium]|nr:hypothetical protein [bacterium]
MKLNKSFWWSIAVIVPMFALALIVSCGGDDGDDGGGGQAKWTVMLYGAGNNDLDQANNGTSYIVQDVQDMEKVGSQSGLNMIAMVSKYNGGGNARYYKVEYFPNENPNELSSPELENLGTKDMSDPQTLRNFLNYCKANYPAENYQLIIDDHGAGWPGSCSDELAGAGGLLTLPETREAIATSDLQRVDVLTWHACLMSMAEVAYELRSVCDYMTSCQFTMPMENILGADLWLGWLKDNQGASNEDYAHKVVESVIQRAQFKQKTTHYAMIKMSEMQNLGAALGNFGNILVQEGGAHWNEVLTAWNSTHSTNLDNPTYVDVREFTNQIQAQPNLAASNLINQNAVAVRNALNAAVPFTDTYFHSPDNPVPRGGLNVYIPWQLNQFVPDSVSYSNLQWRSTNWHSFVSTFVRSLGGGQDPTGRCCYNNNADCADNVTQAQCATVTGVWTEGATCAQGCGGQDPTGRCCYNNNADCADNVTQAQCATVAGVWTQGATCAQGCGGGGTDCPMTCEAAGQIALGTIVGCDLQGSRGDAAWLRVPITTGTYHFELATATGNDYDVYTFAPCGTQMDCGSEATGNTEDFTCDFTGQGDLFIAIAIWDGAGSFEFRITQIGIIDQPGAIAVK